MPVSPAVTLDRRIERFDFHVEIVICDGEKPSNSPPRRQARRHRHPRHRARLDDEVFRICAAALNLCEACTEHAVPPIPPADGARRPAAIAPPVVGAAVSRREYELAVAARAPRAHRWFSASLAHDEHKRIADASTETSDIDWICSPTVYKNSMRERTTFLSTTSEPASSSSRFVRAASARRSCATARSTGEDTTCLRSRSSPVCCAAGTAGRKSQRCG